ncbi:MAG: helix-turn-helix domain-containing protein [Brucella sp.]
MIELLSLHQPSGVSELARLTDMPKSTAQRILLALERTGWIEPAPTDRRLCPTSAPLRQNWFN